MRFGDRQNRGKDLREKEFKEDTKVSAVGDWVPGYAITWEEEQIWWKENVSGPVESLGCLLGTIWWMFSVGS